MTELPTLLLHGTTSGSSAYLGLCRLFLNGYRVLCKLLTPETGTRAFAARLSCLPPSFVSLWSSTRMCRHHLSCCVSQGETVVKLLSPPSLPLPLQPPSSKCITDTLQSISRATILINIERGQVHNILEHINPVQQRK